MKYQRFLSASICILFLWGCSFPKPPREYRWRFVRFAKSYRFPYHVWQKNKPYCAYASMAMYLRVIIEGFKAKGFCDEPDLNYVLNYAIDQKIGIENQGLSPYDSKKVLALLIANNRTYGRGGSNELCAFGLQEDTVGDVRIDHDADAECVFKTLSKSLDINKRMVHFIQNYYHRRRGVYVSFRDFQAESTTGESIHGPHAVYAYGIYRDENDKLEYDDADDVRIYVANPQERPGRDGSIILLNKEKLENYSPRAVIYDQGVTTVK